MIETLRIHGLAIVDEAELSFTQGLNVLTGETGAGKSIVLGALALLAGAELAKAAGVGQYFLFHHDPARDDAGVAAIEDRAKELFENAEAAREGRVIELSASATRAA